MAIKVRTPNKFFTQFDDNGRVCTSCLTYKEWSHFKSHLRSATKRSSQCKECYKTKRKSAGRQTEKASSRARNDLLKREDPYLWKSRQVRGKLYGRFKDPEMKATTPSREAIEAWLRKGPLVCYYSGESLTLLNMTIDHKQPVNRGGDNSFDNLCFAARSMNSAKGTMNEEEFKGLLALVSTWEDKGVSLMRRLRQGLYG